MGRACFNDKGGWEWALLAKALMEQVGLTLRRAGPSNGEGAAVRIQLRRLRAGVPLGKKICDIEFQLGNLLFKGWVTLVRDAQTADDPELASHWSSGARGCHSSFVYACRT